MMQGRAKREKRPMTEEPVYIGVDIAKNTLEVAASNLKMTIKVLPVRFATSPV